jgi:hypothetical protein
MDAAQTQGTVMKAICYNLIWGYLFIASLALAQQRDYFLPKPTVHNYAIILGGAAAEKKYGDQIRHWALQLHDTLTVDYGYRSDQIILLMGQVEPDDARISGPCRREVIQDKIQALRKVLQPGDRIFFFLLGHGTANEKEAKFVILGPDITGEDFATILEALPEQDVVVVNTTSASYPFSHALSGPGRVIISATRSRAEKYNTIFAEYFIAALDKHTGDRDKNRRVSMWEAFLFAGQRVEKWYTDQNRIPTEHAVLDDNGDGFFSAEPDPAKDDGRLAQIAYLDLLPAERTLEYPPGVDVTLVNNLTAKLRELERSVFLLRNRKAELPQAAYQEQMESLLIDIARTSRKLRRINPVPNEPSYIAPHDS